MFGSIGGEQGDQAAVKAQVDRAMARLAERDDLDLLDQRPDGVDPWPRPG